MKGSWPITSAPRRSGPLTPIAPMAAPRGPIDLGAPSGPNRPGAPMCPMGPEGGWGAARPRLSGGVLGGRTAELVGRDLGYLLIVYSISPTKLLSAPPWLGSKLMF